MSKEDIVDPRAVPRWVEAGVSGIPRGREWDGVAVMELPELEASLTSELSFRVLEDGSSVRAEGIPGGALERMTRALAGSLRAPYEALAVRRGPTEWSVAAREVRLERLELPHDLGADELAVALAPDGERTLLVDGAEPTALTPPLEAALAELERRGRNRFPAFVARAERVSEGRFELSVDPL